MSTSLGHGIAIPHARDFIFPKPFDVVSVVFLKSPIDYGALDGEKVKTLFFLFACDEKRHLNLLAKIAHLVKSDETRSFLSLKPQKADLLTYVKEWEMGFCRI
jgi:PTS system nitrogen regulatory IIA component